MNRRGCLKSAALALLLTVPSAAIHAQTAGAGEWSTPMQLTTDRSEIGAVLIGGKLYVAGGNALGRQDSPLFQELDLATGRWRDLAPMPRGSSHLVMATLNGKIYLAGGFTANVHRNPLDQFLEYDPATNQWRPLAPLSSPRGAVGLVAVGGLIHAIGGRGPDGNVVATHEVYNTATNSWAPKAPLPVARDHLGIAVVDGQIHVFGGRTGATVDRVAEHDVYDPATDRWRQAAPLITPRSAGASVVYRGLIVYAGGECKDPMMRKTFDEVEAYDPKTDRWTSLAKHPTGFHAAAAFANGPSAYIVGGNAGCGGDKPLATIQALRLP
jgi:N-acetylneuraminic acid mutarotase